MFKQKGSLNVVIALAIGIVIVGGGYLVWQSQQGDIDLDNVDTLQTDIVEKPSQAGYFGGNTDTAGANQNPNSQNPKLPAPPETNETDDGSSSRSNPLVPPPPPPPPPGF